jgi:hypothetical protein
MKQGGSSNSISELCIQEVASSNLRQNTNYPDWSFLWFPLVFIGECQNSILN